MSSHSVKGAVSRRSMLKLGTGLGLTSAVGIAPQFLASPAWATPFASGMTGGPVGFSGAERYQYNAGMSEGRAIEGIKALKAAGKAPKKLVFNIADGAIGQINKSWPAGAPSVKDVWERETGIELELVGVSPAESYTRTMQDIVTRSGAYDIYTTFFNDVGDLVETNGIVDMTEFVGKYKPDWDDPERGAPSPTSYNFAYRYNNRHWCISLDGDFQLWVYRKDLFSDPANQKEYGDRYKMPLRAPSTWTEVDQISEFFKGKGMNGHSNMLSPFWGISTWFNRFVSYDNPNLYPFDPTGKPLINSDAGIKAAEAHVRSRQWSSKDILSWTWSEGFGSIGDGTSAMMCTFANVVKFMDRKNADGTPATPATGKLDSCLPVGTVHGDKLVRRSSLYLNTSASISAQSKYPEAAYLFLHWLSSTRVYTWLSSNPAGFYDPWQLANMSDPLVTETYHAYAVPMIRETIIRSAPTLSLPGTRAMYDALDKNLQAAMTGGKSVKDAMNDAAAEWTRVVRRKGMDRMVEQMNASRQGYPTKVDPVPG